MAFNPPSSVLVALSGGVDSSLAACLLKESGWDVLGVHFIIPGPQGEREKKGGDVESVARHLGIPLRLVDIRDRFEERVIQPFLDAYMGGRTPNPCVVCNPRVKFESLAETAEREGVAFMSTGHYARILPAEDGILGLFRGTDTQKDQSYFLHRLGPHHLGRTLFPLGEMSKNETREMARRKGLPATRNPESQEICFIPNGDYRSFLRARRGDSIARPGDIVDRNGRKLGRHGGTHGFTIGQRRGLGVASERPYYVTELRPARNQVVVGRKEDLFQRKVEAKEFSSPEGRLEITETRATAQIRYRHKPAPGILKVLSQDRIRFEFDDPQPAVTPGQALVCYQADRVLGGGWIVGDETD